MLIFRAWATCDDTLATIYPRATKISNREPERALKTYDSQANFRRTNNKIPCSFCTFETKKENFQLSAVRKKIFPTTKGKQTSTCLQIRFCDFRCSAVEVSRLKMQGHPTTIFGRISVRKTILDLEFSEHLL